MHTPFMNSPKSPIGPTSPPHTVVAPGERPRTTVTIGELSDKVLLDIFCYYMDASPRFWPRLVHICRRWRRVVFASQRVLHLQLFCTYGTPVLKSLDCWPALPIVMQYGGSPKLDPPTPEDEDNIVAALNQSGRVSSINLTVTKSLLKKLSAMGGPVLELEELVLLSRGSPLTTIPSTFGWSTGTRLRRLHLTGIDFSPLHLFRSSRGLVDLRLHEVLSPRLFSPKALTDALSGLAQLRSLSLQFLPTTNHIGTSLPSKQRVVLPALTCLDLQGATEYLEDLVAGIDAPCLGDIEVTFFSSKTTSNFSKLRAFIDRIELHKSPRRADILSSEGSISISLTQPEVPTCLKLQLIGMPVLAWQLAFIAQICIHFSAFLFDVEDLRICATRESSQGDSLYFERWLEHLGSFTGVKWLHVSGNPSTYIVHALNGAERRKTVLPALYKLCISQIGSRHAHWSKAVLLFMTSRRHSGHHIAVEYERHCDINELRGAEHFSPQVMIGMLNDDVLLNIFHHYLDATPQFWPTLTCVCQRWRQIVHISPLGLNLHLYCTHGTPVLTTLDCWPALPIIVQYGGVPNLDPPTPEDDHNIIAALKHSGRVSSISLTVTSSLFEKLSAISEPFPELEELTLLSQDNMKPILPGTFRWGPRLRTLHSTGIALPSFPQLLSLSQNLVSLQLYKIPSAGYFSPYSFANALSGMSQLKTLSLHFLSLPPRRNYLSLPPTGERAVLPVLTRLEYRGTSNYLDSFVARIDAPRLGDIDIRFFSQPTIDVSELGRFIERIETQTPNCQADVKTTAHAISISFSNSNTPSPLRLQISCEQLDWQLSCMIQVCHQFSPFLFHVQILGINTTQSSSRQDNVGGEQWLELVRSFRGVRTFQIAGEPMTDLLCALKRADGGHTADTIVLPALRNLRVQTTTSIDGSFWDAARSSIMSRQLTSSPINLQVLCHACNTTFTQQRGFCNHIVSENTHRIVCLYCGNFECTPGPNDLFQKHLRSEHQEIARDDASISNPFLTRILRYQPDILTNRHGFPSPRASNLAPSTTVNASHFQ